MSGVVAAKAAQLAAGKSASAKSLVVLIPANDEEKFLAETLRSVKSQLRAGDQILVVADNCVDQTAQIARDAGAEVIERVAPLRRGKGHALSFGVDHLKQTKRMPRVTIVIDADCKVEAGAIEALAARVIAIGRPVQAIYLLDQPANEPTPQTMLSWMAFLVRNGIRPGGANRLGLPCHLTGSGMAHPWHVLSSVKLGRRQTWLKTCSLGLSWRSPVPRPRCVRRLEFWGGFRWMSTRPGRRGHAGNMDIL